MALALAPGGAARALAARLADPASVFSLDLPTLAFLSGVRPAALAFLARGDRLLDAARREIERAERLGVVLVPETDPRYPPLLRHIHDPPVVLWVRGRCAAFARPALAVVGTRRPTPAGLAVAARLARLAVARGHVVTSGGATGIDGAAHRGALAAARDGEPVTVAVLGCGVDVVYPREHAGLLAAVAERGAVCSERPLGSPPLRHAFPRRNRLISGMAACVVVVQAPARSGALLTAVAALEQGRDVGACPWSADVEEGAGCRALLDDGALEVLTGDEVLPPGGTGTAPALGGLPGAVLPAGLDADQRRLLALLGPRPLPLAVVARLLGAALPETAARLMELELLGHARAWPGPAFTRN